LPHISSFFFEKDYRQKSEGFERPSSSLGEAKELEQQIKAKEKQKAMAEMDRREAGRDGDGDGDGWVGWIVGNVGGFGVGRS